MDTVYFAIFTLCSVWPVAECGIDGTRSARQDAAKKYFIKSSDSFKVWGVIFHQTVRMPVWKVRFNYFETKTALLSHHTCSDSDNALLLQ